VPRIAYQGEPGAFSHEACRRWFPDHEPAPHATFEQAFDAVAGGACALGMIPIENSVAGRVSDVHHLLPASGLKIVGERFLPIHMHLLAPKGTATADIRFAASHPMALTQCRLSLRRLGITPEVAGDTAGAARLLAEAPQPGRAAVASVAAAELYGLEILARNLEDDRSNTTRFLVLSAEREIAPPPFTDRCVTAFTFRVRNVAAALYKALGGFATNGVNMTKLESYMEAGSFTATFFYAEVDGRPEERGLATALEELRFFSSQFELLGVFPADPFRDR
jgi:prephenate dehydratase